MTGPPLSSWLGFPRRHPAWTTVLVVLLLGVLLLVLVDWNWARRPAERIVSGLTGREFRIDGNFDVDLIPLEIQAEKVYFGNPSWSTEPAMFQADRVDMRLRFWPLLAGRLTLPRLEVDQPHLRLERNSQGVGNWVLKPRPECASGGCESRLHIRQLVARQGRLEFNEPTFETAIDVLFESVRPASDDALAPLSLRGSGTYRAAPFELTGQVDSPLELRGKAQPYQIDVTATAGDSRARVSGTLAEPLQLGTVAVNFELSGADLADLYEFAGIVLPTTPPYDLKGRLSRNGRRYSYEDFSGTVGDSDVAGDASFELGGDRPKLTARLTSGRIDFDDLAGFVGGTPGTGEGEAASAEQKEKARKQRATGKVLPSSPIRLDRLRSMDADVTLDAAKVESRRLPLESMQAHLQLEDGRLTVKPLRFGAAGGTLASTVTLDARHDPARFAMDMQLRQLELPKLMPRVKQMQDALGNLSGMIELRGEGNSTASVLASADGQFGVVMGRGRMSNLLLEVAGLDVAEALAFLIGKDQQVTLRCAYADFGVADGVATVRSAAFDTTDTALLLRGELSFRDESLDLTMLPRPKDVSPVSFRTPVRIKGTFADPEIDLKSGPLVFRGAALAALTAIAPPLALIALAEPGPGKDTGCGAGTPAAELVPPPANRTTGVDAQGNENAGGEAQSGEEDSAKKSEPSIEQAPGPRPGNPAIKKD